MRSGRKGFNPKRCVAPLSSYAPDDLCKLAEKAIYTGSAQHKKHPNDDELSPANDPRPGATLCDGNGPIPKTMACKLLKRAFKKGMVSVQDRNGWPQNIWAVAEDGEVYEAQLENCACGHYHGYPIPLADNFRDIVQAEWKNR